jgi:hypothetical protein
MTEYWAPLVTFHNVDLKRYAHDIVLGWTSVTEFIVVKLDFVVKNLESNGEHATSIGKRSFWLVIN